MGARATTTDAVCSRGSLTAQTARQPAQQLSQRHTSASVLLVGASLAGCANRSCVPSWLQGGCQTLRHSSGTSE
jgi:hypothetical protein